MDNNYYPFVNLPLPYAYDALEPFIDEKTMMLHHDRHLQTYIDNLNNALKTSPELQKLSLEQLIRNASRLPEPLQTTIRNNAGGVYNHRFFFDGLKAPAGQKAATEAGADMTSAAGSTQENRPAGILAQKLGSFDTFKDIFRKAALSVFGSGYAWLVTDGGRLRIVTSQNQNAPIEQGLCPVLAIDVWEHAYYLKHYNVRVDYIDDWFRVVDWNQAEKKYQDCISGMK
ncbi:MAG: superoxide dismutase [Lentihominibacter sp.]